MFYKYYFIRGMRTSEKVHQYQIKEMKCRYKKEIEAYMDTLGDYTTINHDDGKRFNGYLSKDCNFMYFYHAEKRNKKVLKLPKQEGDTTKHSYTPQLVHEKYWICRVFRYDTTLDYKRASQWTRSFGIIMQNQSYNNV